MYLSEIYCRGYSGEDPPLPIPNREVKLTIADGTDPPVGRVGSRRFRVPDHQKMTGDFFCALLSRPWRASERLLFYVFDNQSDNAALVHRHVHQ